MMICDEWKSFLHDYVLGDLGDAARELLDRHAASCAVCLGEARVLKLVDRRLREEPAIEPPAGLERRALEEIPARVGREIWRVAAALLLAGGIGALSVSGLADLLPDDVRAVPATFTRAARFLPHVTIFEVKE